MKYVRLLCCALQGLVALLCYARIVHWTLALEGWPPPYVFVQTWMCGLSSFGLAVWFKRQASRETNDRLTTEGGG